MNRHVLAGAAFMAVCAAAVATDAAPAQEEIPIFTPSTDSAWNANYWDYLLPAPPGAGHGPIRTDPKYPYNTQIQNGTLLPLLPGEYRVPIVDTKDPVLKPWAAKQIQETNDDLLSGKRDINFAPQSRCWPGGLPYIDLYLEPVFFLQTPKEVTILWQRDNFTRHIFLRDKHSEHVTPSWFGESIGHYEGSDTLVVDTIGIKGGKYHYMDNFRTPHTDKLHVVERFTISPDKKKLSAIIKVEDPDTFNEPLTLTQEWRRTKRTYEESICAEDGGIDYLGHNPDPIPLATKPDF